MSIPYLKIFIGKTEYLGGWLSVGPPRSRCRDGWNAQENLKGNASQRKWGSNHDGHHDGLWSWMKEREEEARLGGSVLDHRAVSMKAC